MVIPESESSEAESSEASSAENARPSLMLSTAAQYLRGVGPERGLLLAKLGIRTAQDALFTFPRSYRFPPPLTKIAELKVEEAATCLARVSEIDQRITGAGKSIIGVLVEDESAAARLLFFNQPFRLETMRRGDLFLISGTPKLNGLRMEFMHPMVQAVDDAEELQQGTILPVYPLTEGLKQSSLRRAIANVVDGLADVVPEVLPESIRSVYAVRSIADALRGIHRPQSEEDLEGARRRFVFQELLILQLALARKRYLVTSALRSPALAATPEIDSAIQRRFGFTLTGDQQRVIREVAADMNRQFPMNRLVQGDVGSGKTVIAQYAMLLAVAHRAQAVLMAPTDVLARQHFQTFTESLAGSRVRIGLLSGSLRGSERRAVIEQAGRGEIDLLIGTQALLYNDVVLPSLGLVVIDEQHKFGVNQRAKLRGDGLDPHYLVLSATPIPRTMAMTLFGDLDISTLREKPAGRGVVKTYLAKADWKPRWWDFVAQRLDEGRQAYVVTPLVDATSTAGETQGEERPGEDVSAAEQIFEQLRSGPFQQYRLGLLHGRLSGEEKNELMQRFAQGRIQMLVTTTVIEVGINVPNATVMTILGAERFGLAQLHQLRGRISRGKHPGHVAVFTDRVQSAEDVERLQVFADCEDGFALAEADYRLRGPGDLLGTRQSGMPPLKVADPERDSELLQTIRDLAQTMIEEDPNLDAEAMQRLKAQMLRRYGKVLDLGDVA